MVPRAPETPVMPPAPGASEVSETSEMSGVSGIWRGNAWGQHGEQQHSGEQKQEGWRRVGAAEHCEVGKLANNGANLPEVHGAGRSDNTTHTHTHIHTRAYTHAYTRAPTDTYRYTERCTRTHMHTCTHTRTRTQKETHAPQLAAGSEPPSCLRWRAPSPATCLVARPPAKEKVRGGLGKLLQAGGVEGESM